MAIAVQESHAVQLEALLANMTFRERLNLLVEIGVSPETIMSVPKCTSHLGGRLMTDSSPLDFNGGSMWCRGCYAWWYL